MLDVFDATGRKIETKTMPAGSSSQIGQHYRPGVYFIRLGQDGQEKELRLIKAIE